MPQKLPEITLAFWIMKICATTLGETAGDLLSMTFAIGYFFSFLILISFFVITLGLQLLSRTYHPFLYWSVILSTSTAGTTMSDYIDRSLGLGYMKGAAILLTLLMSVLGLWRYTTGSLAIQKINNRTSEVFYWIAILFSNTLGTALGDFLADSSGLGFLGGALLISGVITLISLFYYYQIFSHVLLFWAAFILTRPLGATMGDLMTKTHAQGGFNLGTKGSSFVLFSTLLIFIIFSHRKSAAARLKD